MEEEIKVVDGNQFSNDLHIDTSHESLKHMRSTKLVILHFHYYPQITKIQSLEQKLETIEQQNQQTHNRFAKIKE